MLRLLANMLSLTPSHRAMLSYLLQAGMNDTYQALEREASITDFDGADPKSKSVGLLEKKWTSVIRLQKKVRNALCSAWLTADHGSGVTKCCSAGRTGLTYTSDSSIVELGTLRPTSASTAHPQLTPCDYHTSHFPSQMDSPGECQRGRDSQDLGLGKWRL